MGRLHRISDGKITTDGPDRDGEILLDVADEGYVFLSRVEARELAQDLADRLGLCLTDPATVTKVEP